jgi:superfamily II DNA or RNA helicase
MIKLRTYQINQIDEIRKAFVKAHNSVIMQAPTGSGKTVMFSYMVKAAAAKQSRCLILTDRVEILEQAGGTFDRVGIDYQNITAKTKAVPNSKVCVAMVETIKRRLKSRLDFQMYLKKIDLLIIDEAHKAAFDSVFAYLKDECYVIGATATPIRTNVKKPLKDYFTAIVEGANIASLIQQQFLSKPKYYGVSVDLSKVKMKAGEFDERDQEKVFSEVKVFEGLKHNLGKYAKGKKTMIFCPSVQSSLNVAHELGCLHLDGEMNSKQRTEILTEFETTPDSVITNCAITTTGYDHAEIECIVLYRATTSLPLYLQMIGRGSRVTETKRAFTILDFGMNVQRFGYWHIERKWSLELPKKISRKKDVFPVKFCPECGAIVSVNVKTCEYCGYIWPVTERERMFAELQELTYVEIQKKMNEATSIEEMEQIRIAKGYKVGYLFKVNII